MKDGLSGLKLELGVIQAGVQASSIEQLFVEAFLRSEERRVGKECRL